MTEVEYAPPNRGAWPLTFTKENLQPPHTMKIQIFLDHNTPLKELPQAEFPIVPRQGEVIQLTNGNEYTVTEVMWSANEYELAYPTLTVREKHI